MGEELRGKNYLIVGSDGYFSDLNRNLRIEFMGNEFREYYKSFRNAGRTG